LLYYGRRASGRFQLEILSINKAVILGTTHSEVDHKKGIYHTGSGSIFFKHRAVAEIGEEKH